LDATTDDIGLLEAFARRKRWLMRERWRRGVAAGRFIFSSYPIIEQFTVETHRKNIYE
jgi:hypothetical protein